MIKARYNWQAAPEVADQQQVKALQDQLGISAVFATLLVKRG